jgi:hypothetical protein
MVHTTVDRTFRQTNLTNESREYLAKRETAKRGTWSALLLLFAESSVRRPN